jgi:hypothetical protein
MAKKKQEGIFGSIRINKQKYIDEFIKLYKEGLNDSEIARCLGINNVTVSTWRNDRNLPKNFQYKRKFDTNQFNGKITGKKLVKDYKGYGMQMCVFFYEKDLFIDYHEFGSETLNFPYQLFDYFEPLEEIDGYYHLGYTNFLNKVTFSDGTMRIKSELSEYILQNKENKSSKFLTFPLDLDDFEKNFECAKNMKIGIEFYAGAMQNFRLTLRMNLNLRKDFFYNHMNESILIGTHNNEVLDTVDNFYA